MSYVVFSRKYRPQSFDEVVGQEHVGRTLASALQAGRVAHAYLFAGPRGVGKTTMARLLAKAVNCLESPGPEPCGACEACRGIAAGQDVDVIEIDAASVRRVEDIQPIVETSRYLPQRCPRKIFIVDEVHMLSRHAFNALLKTLEEPPPHVLFILATTEPQRVPDTVRSRCQRFDFKRLGAADIAGKLGRIARSEGAQVEAEVLEEIARRSAGGLRDAESLLDQLLGAAPPDRAVGPQDLVAVVGDVPREMRLSILEKARAGSMAEVLDLAAEVVAAGADPASLLADLYGDLRDAAVEAARSGGDGSGPGVEWCLAAAEVVQGHLARAARSRAAHATLDLALLALARLGDVRDLEELVGRLERLEGGGEAPPAARPTPAPQREPRGPSARREPDAAPPPEPALRSAKPPGSAPDITSGSAAGNASGSAAETASGADRPPRPRERPGSPPGSQATPRPRAEAARAERVSEPRPLEPRRPRAENGPRSEPRGEACSLEERKRIESLPLVRRVLETFGGHIENVRREHGQGNG